MKKLPHDNNRLGNIPTLDDVCGVHIFQQITQPTLGEPLPKPNNSEYKITLPSIVKNNYIKK